VIRITLRFGQRAARFKSPVSELGLQFMLSELLNLLIGNYPAAIKFAMGLIGRSVATARKPTLPLSMDEQEFANKRYNL